MEEWVTVEGRQIKIFDEEKNQSVNVCTPANTDGQYANKVYFTGKFRVTPDDFRQFTALTPMLEWLWARSYRQLYELGR